MSVNRFALFNSKRNSYGSATVLVKPTHIGKLQNFKNFKIHNFVVVGDTSAPSPFNRLKICQELNNKFQVFLRFFKVLDHGQTEQRDNPHEYFTLAINDRLFSVSFK